MTLLVRNLVLPIFAILVLVGVAATADAQSLDAFRANGVLAENYDGYVAVRDPNAPGAAKSLAKEVNQKRRQVYDKRAKQEGVSVAEVGQIYAKEIFAKAPSGTYFKQANGSYVQK